MALFNVRTVCRNTCRLICSELTLFSIKFDYRRRLEIGVNGGGAGYLHIIRSTKH